MGRGPTGCGNGAMERLDDSAIPVTCMAAGALLLVATVELVGRLGGPFDGGVELIVTGCHRLVSIFGVTLRSTVFRSTFPCIFPRQGAE